MHKFRIPMKPVSLNQAYRKTRGGMMLSDKGRKFKDDCADFLREQFLEDEPLNYKIKIHIHVQLASRDMDVDNMTKLLIDSMKEIVFTDDKLIFDMRVTKELYMRRNEIHMKVEESEGLEELRWFE